MEKKEKNGNKTEKILKGAAFAGAAGVGALGAMAFTTPDNNEEDEIVAEEEPVSQNQTKHTFKQAEHQESSDSDNTIEAKLSDEQVEDLKNDLREEIKEELRNDDEFKRDIADSIQHNDNKPEADDNQHGSSNDDSNGNNSGEHEPEIEVLSYETIDNGDGSQSDVAVIKVDGTGAAIIDFDQDGQADAMMVDSNHNMSFDSEDQIHNISEAGINMQPFCDAVRNDGNLLVAESDSTPDNGIDDYNNDADVSDFLV